MSNYQLFRVVVAAVIHDGHGRFLLAQRHARDEHQPGFWAIPAGHTEEVSNSLDSLEENLKREVLEEIGVKIRVESYLDSHSWITDDYKKITIAFLCTIESGEPRPLDETQEIKWIFPQELKGFNLAPHIQRLLNKASSMV